MNGKNKRRLLMLLLLAGTVAAIFPRMYSFIPTNALEEKNDAMHAENKKKVFSSTLAGTWYEADKNRLMQEIDGYLAKADPIKLEAVQALVLPHAGYRYSGAAAAFGLKHLVQGKYSRVIVMGPSHRAFLQNVAHVSDATHFSTPLGEVPLDVEAIAELLKHPEFRVVRGVDEAEHSVQIQVPLLQRVMDGFKLVPIVVGNLDKTSAEKMAKILLHIVDSETLVVASSDFTHYGVNYGYVPFTDNIAENLSTLDMGAWEQIKKKDPDGLRRYIDSTGATICGRHPISILLSMLPPASEAHLLKYDVSSRITGDEDMSVSYVTLAFTGNWAQTESVSAASAPRENTLSEKDQVQLLALARGMLETYIMTGKIVGAETLGITVTPGMSQVMGAFVTLTLHGDLRGCIGEIFPRRPLYKAVMEHAVNAGVNDHRFRLVTEKELPLLHYEISALTLPVPVASYKDIVIGKHGMVIEKNGRSAVFLPQVAPEQGWSLEETLTHLSMKAGLAPDAWKEGASWVVFEAIVFHEQE